MSCCKQDPEDAPKPLRQRGCTDCFCLLLFIVFFAALVAVLVFALYTGDINMLRYSADYLGNRCGCARHAPCTPQ